MAKIRRAGLIEKTAEVRPLSALRWLDSVRRDFFLDRPTTILAEPVCSKIKTDLSRGGVMIETQHPTEADSSYRAKR